MEDRCNKLEEYLETLKQEGAKVPGWAGRYKPHIKVISAASGIPLRHLRTAHSRQRIAHAVREIGIERIRVPKGLLTERNRMLVCSYLKSLEECGQKLPEDPHQPGSVLLAQVEVEAGLKQDSLHKL